MSILSHYNAIINIYTYKNIPNFQQLVETAIKHAPQITGSEGNCKMLLINFQSYGSYSYNCGAVLILTKRHHYERLTKMFVADLSMQENI